NVDEYIAGFPKDIQRILQKIRKTIKRAAPGAEEKISYQIPGYALEGNLVHFAAYKEHIGIYPAPRSHEQFKEELSGYAGSKSTLKLQYDKAIPLDLIARIVKFRVKTNLEKAAAKTKSR